MVLAIRPLAGPSLSDALEKLAVTIASDRPLTSEQRHAIAGIIGTLARTPKALNALWPPKRGRKSMSNDVRMALDYIVQKELLGKAEAAKLAVAQAWHVGAGTVADAHTECGEGAGWMFELFNRGLNGRRRVPALRALADDLREQGRLIARKK